MPGANAAVPAASCGPQGGEGQGIICAHKSGSSVHTGFPHLLRHALWIICAHKASVIWLICTHTHTLLAGWGGGGGGLVSTPAQVRPLSTVGGGWWGGGGNGKHTRSSAPAQRCFHACGRVARRGCHLISIPAHVQQMGCGIGEGWGGGGGWGGAGWGTPAHARPPSAASTLTT